MAKVRDDGRGIAEAVAEQQPGSIGIGIGGMSQRAKEFGGELRLTQAHPGTLVEIMIPCNVPAPQEEKATA
jgi:signal transduction histidine kinase